MKAEVMRCIWKSMKACRSVVMVRAGGRAGAPAPGAPAHLLQHGLLGKVELLEPVVLVVVAGGMQVVGVHLGQEQKAG